MAGIDGYVGKILRVDLSNGKIRTEDLQESMVKKWVGGVGFGVKYLYDEVPPGVEWSDPENRLILTTGPLAGSGVSGAATFNVTSKGPMTNLAGSSQANGFFGAYLKFSGFDGIVLQGASPHLVYLRIKDGKAEIRDARNLAGTDVWTLEDGLREQLGVKRSGCQHLRDRPFRRKQDKVFGYCWRPRACCRPQWNGRGDGGKES